MLPPNSNTRAIGSQILGILENNSLPLILLYVPVTRPHTHTHTHKREEKGENKFFLKDFEETSNSFYPTELWFLAPRILHNATFIIITTSLLPEPLQSAHCNHPTILVTVKRKILPKCFTHLSRLSSLVFTQMLHRQSHLNPHHHHLYKP